MAAFSAAGSTTSGRPVSVRSTSITAERLSSSAICRPGMRVVGELLADLALGRAVGLREVESRGAATRLALISAQWSRSGSV